MSATQSPIRQALAAERVLRVGHRGAAALAPANTLASIDAALALGVDMVEIDLARDGSSDLVVAHESGSVSAESPGLETALEHLRSRTGAETTVAIDLKVGDAARELVEILCRLDMVGRSIVCALHPEWLVELHRLEPDLALGLSYPLDRARIGERPRMQLLVRIGTSALRALLPRRIVGMARRAGADAVWLHHGVISPATVQRCAAHGIPVFAWTVDDAEVAAAMAAAGVRGVVSNDPRVLSEI